jgi:hypothetical protein
MFLTRDDTAPVSSSSAVSLGTRLRSLAILLAESGSFSMTSRSGPCALLRDELRVIRVRDERIGHPVLHERPPVVLGSAEVTTRGERDIRSAARRAVHLHLILPKGRVLSSQERLRRGTPVAVHRTTRVPLRASWGNPRVHKRPVSALTAGAAVLVGAEGLEPEMRRLHDSLFGLYSAPDDGVYRGERVQDVRDAYWAEHRKVVSPS